MPYDYAGPKKRIPLGFHSQLLVNVHELSVQGDEGRLLVEMSPSLTHAEYSLRTLAGHHPQRERGSMIAVRPSLSISAPEVRSRGCGYNKHMPCECLAVTGRTPIWQATPARK